MTTFVEVPKEQFWKIIYDNDLDICVKAHGINIDQIMITDFKFRSGIVFGYGYHNYNFDSEKYGEQTYKIDKDWIKD